MLVSNPELKIFFEKVVHVEIKDVGMQITSSVRSLDTRRGTKLSGEYDVNWCKPMGCSSPKV